MPWYYIKTLLGPGLHWSKTSKEFKQLIARAESEGMFNAAEHLKIMLELRDKVYMKTERMYPDEQKEPD